SDPLAGVLSALGGVPEGWRALVQVVLRPAPDRWASAYTRMSLESPLEYERQRAMAQAAARTDNSTQLQVLLLLLGMVAFITAWQVCTWYLDDNWWALATLALAVVAGVPAAIWLWWR